MTRLMAILISIFVLTVPAEAQRPRPLGWAMDAMRSGNWDAAAALAARDGQVAVDMTNANSVPTGHGHNYGDYVLDGWVAVAPPDGWTREDTERIRIALQKTESEDGPEY